MLIVSEVSVNTPPLLHGFSEDLEQVGLFSFMTLNFQALLLGEGVL